MSNEIKTAKFSKSDWLATALLLQFKKPLNLYFLFITLIHFIDGSPKDPWVNLLTFSVFILLLVLKEYYEDIPSQKHDKMKNEVLQDVYSFGSIGFVKRPQ